MGVVHLNADKFRLACQARGWRTIAESARHCGVSRETLHRALAGGRPSNETIGGILDGLRGEFADLFEVGGVPS